MTTDEEELIKIRKKDYFIFRKVWLKPFIIGFLTGLMTTLILMTVKIA